MSPVSDNPVLPRPQLALIDGFTSHLRLERHLSTNTVAAYRTDLIHLATFLHRSFSSLEDADHAILRRFLAQQHALGYARASIARRVGAIHTFYRWAVDDGTIAHDPSLLLGRPKVANRLPTVLRAGEAADLVEGPDAEELDDPLERAVVLRDRAILELLYGSGLRVSEVTALGRDDLDLDGARVLVRGKGSTDRRVPVSDDAVAAVRVWLTDGRPQMAAGRSAVLESSPQADVAARRPSDGRWVCWEPVAGTTDRTPHAPPLVRDASARRRGGHPRCAGAPRT